jgi:hypothetical protein
MATNRPLLIVLLIWALLMIVPDLARVVRPLASFGFYTDGNGVVYDARGPFDEDALSPAWAAGIRAGDQLDLSRMRCLPFDRERCAAVLTVVGGIQNVLPGRTLTLDFAASEGQAARQVTIAAAPRTPNWLVRGVLLLDQIAGILVVLAAGWLVWTRPGPMSWGFFLYIIWFNPGQSFEFYAHLQRWPLLLLAQNVAGCLSQGAGFTGLLLFVMRAPTDNLQPGWQPFERALIPLGAALALALMATYGNLFGFKTEMLTRVTILFGLVISVAAIVILLLRRHSLTPKDNQRLRWVMWGCLIGLPATVIADLAQYTALFSPLWGDASPPEDLIGLLYLINGILCLFVFEAIRRPRVVNVAIPLRRVTVLALTMSVPALFLHHEAERFQEALDVPRWAWFLVGAVAVFAIGQLHHAAVELADRYFNRELDKAERNLGQAILTAREPAAIDRLLADGVLGALSLTSAATFRRNDAGYHRYENGVGWNDAATRDLELEPSELASLAKGQPSTISDEAARKAAFPADLEKPIRAIGAASRAYCYAIALYGPHDSGTDLDANECNMLESLGHQAADAYARLDNEHLRRVIAKLEALLPLANAQG